MSYTVILDPSAVATGRRELDLNSGPIRVAQAGIDWGDAAITAFMADQQRYGSAPVEFRIPNRMVTIPLGLGMDDSDSEETVRSQLQQKVALLQREGGWLLRQTGSGPAMYADVVNATLHLPDVWGDGGGVEPDVVLTLECLPDFYGDEIALNTITATGECHAVLTGSTISEGENVIADGSFESDTVGALPPTWVDTYTSAYLVDGATAVVTTAEHKFGTKSLQVNTSGGNEGVGCVPITPKTFKAGQQYTFSTWLKGNAGGEQVALLFGAQYPNNGDTAASAVATLTTAWQQFSVTWTPTADRTAVFCALPAQTASAQEFFVDGVVVNLGDTPLDYGTNLYDNRVPDPSFEYDAIGECPPTYTNGQVPVLVAGGPASAVSVVGGGYVGSKCLKVVTPVSDASARGTTTTLAEPLGNGNDYQAGVPYTFSVYLKGEQGGEVVTLSLGTAYPNYNFESASVTLTQGWKRYSVTWTCPAYFSGHQVGLTVNAPSTFYADGLMVNPGPTPGDYGDGDQPNWKWVGTPGDSESVRNVPVIDGDYPARCEIQIKDTSGNNQNGLLWGVRSRHYDSGAPLSYDCKDLTLMNGTVTAAATGSYSGTAARIASPLAGTWMPVISTGMLTHQGAYRVWLRVYSDEAPQLKLSWTEGVNAVYESNDAAQVAGSGDFYLVDLGEIWIDAPPDGPCQWNGVISLLSNTGAATAFDRLWLQPLGEAAGWLQWNPQVAPGVISTEALPTTGSDVAVGGNAWTSPGAVVGNSGAQGGLYATSSVTGSNQSKDTDYLEGTGYGFSIPTGATIQGIEVQVHRYKFTAKQGSVTDKLVQLLIGGALSGANRSKSASWKNSNPGWVTFGGPTDLWGLTPTVAQINASNFGVALQAHLSTPAGSGSSAQALAGVNSIQVTVYYTLATGVPVAQDAVVYANATALLRDDGMWRYGPSNTVASPVPVVRGDLARIPPSGIEGRAVELFVKPTRGDADQLPDSAIDGFTVTPIVRPCYLHRP